MRSQHSFAARLTRGLKRFAARCVVLCMAVLLGPMAWAHAMPESRVWVDSTADGMRLTLLLPLNRLEFAFGADLIQAPDQVLAQHRRALAAYVLRHVALRSGDQAWLAFPPTLAIIGSDASADLEAVVEFRAPEGANLREVHLNYDLITHEVKTHRVQVFLRSDWAGGMVAQAPRPLGELDARHVDMTLALPSSASALDGLWQLVHEGVWHILDGADHLLFLLTLLLVSPLVIDLGRWAGARTAGGAWRHTAWVVSAFTIGHTCMLVAATIAVAAIHALKPIKGVGEVAMVLAFGLVCAVLPVLWWVQMRWPRAGAGLRQSLAWIALAAAAWWIHERWPLETVGVPGGARAGLHGNELWGGLALCVSPLLLCAWFGAWTQSALSKALKARSPSARL